MSRIELLTEELERAKELYEHVLIERDIVVQMTANQGISEDDFIGIMKEFSDSVENLSNRIKAIQKLLEIENTS